jgi:hypothetical protein
MLKSNQNEVSKNFTTTQEPFLASSVSHLENKPCPTLKTNTTNDLKVRQPTNKKPYAHTHTRGVFNLDELYDHRKRHFKLHKKSENNFIESIPILFENLMDVKVVYHNNYFVQEIHEAYYPLHAQLFLDWVKTFSLIRSTCRTTIMDGVIYSTDQDFYDTLQLFKLQATRPKYKTKFHKDKIWNTIQTHFAHTHFTIKNIHDKTLINEATISIILIEYKTKNLIKRSRKRSIHKYYQLI